MKKRKGLMLAVAACLAPLAVTPGARAAGEFYSGKTLTIIVPYGPGGGYDTWVRLIAPYMKKSLGLSQITIRNIPGGGGIVGTDQIYGAKADGLTIGDTNAAGDVFSQMAKDPGITFDVRKFAWIGRPDADPHVIAVHADGPYKTFDDLVALHGGKTTLHCLATGHGSSDYNSTVITMNAFGIPYQMVAAFKGSHEEKATFLSGDGDTISLSASDIAQLGPKNARVVVLSAAKPFSKLPNAPTVVQEAKKHKLSQTDIDALTAMGQVMDMGHGFFAPPGVPAARLKALRVAFAKAFKDPDFVAKAKKAGFYVGYEGPSKLIAAVMTAFSHKGELTPLLKTS